MQHLTQNTQKQEYQYYFTPREKYYCEKRLVDMIIYAVFKSKVWDFNA
jgi:hypothetical protein